MKKYIFLIAISIISLANVNLAYAETAEQVCSGKRNGDACSFTSSGRGAQSGRTTSGFCDRTNGDSNAANNPLICRSGDAWKDCVVEGDACLGNAGGGRGGSRELGTCTTVTSSGSPRSSGTTSLVCNTSEKPQSNPGGRASDATGGQVCVNQGGSPVCTDNAVGADGKCGTTTCPGTTTDSGATTNASSPQTVSFPNPSRFTSITALIAGIINALLGILGAITVAVLVASGFKYMTSSNPGEVGQALEGIRNAIVGLMIIMGSFLITQYVISALAGTSTTPTTPTTPTTTTTPGAPTT